MDRLDLRKAMATASALMVLLGALAWYVRNVL